MSGIDELLREHGERWRAEVDAHLAASVADPTAAVTDGSTGGPSRLRRALARRPPPRRLLLWSASVCGAAAAVALGVGLVASASSNENSGSASSRDAGGGHASAAASSASASSAAASSAARPGAAAGAAPSCPAQILRVEAGGDARSNADRSSTPPLRVAAGQLVTVTGTGYDTTTCEQVSEPPPASYDTVTVQLGTADGRTVVVVRARPALADGTFRVRFAIPTDAVPGAATVTDGLGGPVPVTITDR